MIYETILLSSSADPEVPLLIALSVGLAVVAVVNYNKRKKVEDEKKRISSELKKSKEQLEQLRLESLKFQLNPHTIINSISSLTNLAGKTVEGLEGLNSVMSFMLYEGSQKFVSLEKEWEFLQAFISLSKLKLNSSLLTIEPICEIAKDDTLYSQQIIPPFLTAYFVENAFKHGDKTQSGEFTIRLRKADGKLIYTVKNKVQDGNADSSRQSGIGQKNLQERMNILYPNRHNIQYSNENGYYTASITLDLVPAQ